MLAMQTASIFKQVSSIKSLKHKTEPSLSYSFHMFTISDGANRNCRKQCLQTVLG